jgi:hypothetical protein
MPRESTLGCCLRELRAGECDEAVFVFLIDLLDHQNGEQEHINCEDSSFYRSRSHSLSTASSIEDVEFLNCSMFFKLSLISTLLALSSTYASPVEDIFGRSVGGSCKAPEGRGSCQNTSNCKGISYPTGLCPNDPNDVQVRHPLTATCPHSLLRTS